MAHGPSGMSGRLKSVRRVGVGLATDWIFKAGPPLTAFYKLFSGIFCALVLGAGALAQSRDEPGGPDAPRPSGSIQPSSSSTVAPNTTSTGVHFNDPRRASANDDAAASVGGVSIDFDHLGIDPADLAGQNTLPTNLTALEADPNALLDALGDSDLTSLVQDAFDNDVGTGDFDDWVNSIMGGSTDPFEISGLSPSTPTSSCVTTPTRRETTQHSRYSCSVDDGTAVAQPACQNVEAVWKECRASTRCGRGCGRSVERLHTPSTRRIHALNQWVSGAAKKRCGRSVECRRLCVRTTNSHFIV